jgi:AraC-like DNA-binding protein
MQFPPSPAWSFCIKHYLFLKCSYSQPLRLFSDGNTGMVFIIRGQLKIQRKESLNTEILPNTFVYGQIDSYHNVFTEGDTEMLIIVFQPHGFFSLSGIPADELKAQIIDAYSIFGHAIYSFSDALRSAGGYGKAISVAEENFTSLLRNSKLTSDQPGFVVKTVMRARGQLTVNELIKLTGYSERKLERFFHQAIGISPVKYLQIVRLHYFLSLMRSANRNESLTMACLESGYYDQPHLIHNFKQVTGLTPSQYLATASALAVNLIIVN